ncbi:MAG: MFS transporter [Lachnospiraceae bacterium]|nr:MFS transporter [Lachnospiraceae bacterium]
MNQSFSVTAKRQLQTCYGVFVLNGMLALSIGSLLPFIREARGLDYVFAGLIVSLHSIGNLISSFLAGPAAVAFGRKKGVLLFNCFFAISFLLLLVGSSRPVLAAAFFLTGFARGATSNFCNAVVNDLAPGQAAALNGLHAMFSVGAFTFPILLLLITRGDDSRYIWAIVFMLIAGILSFLLYALIPDPDKIRPVAEESGKEEKLVKDSGFGFLKEGIFYLVVLSLFFYLCAEQGVIGWMVTYFKDTGFIGENLSQITASVLWIMILAGRLLTAHLSTRMDKRKLLPFMGAGIVLFFIALLFARNTALIIVCIMGFGFSMAGIYPTVVSFTGDLIRKYSLAWSFVLTMASLGSIVMPSVIGHIAENAGIYMGMSSVAVVVIVDFFLLLFLVRYTGKQKKRDAA